MLAGSVQTLSRSPGVIADRQVGITPTCPAALATREASRARIWIILREREGEGAPIIILRRPGRLPEDFYSGTGGA